MMERDLNFKRLFRMYLLNVWLIVLVGVLTAGLLGNMKKAVTEVKLIKQVYLVFDMQSSAYKELDTKRTAYNDAYRGLLQGNALLDSDVFSETEKSQLQNKDIQMEYNRFTVTLTVPNDAHLESNKEAFERWMQESEKWMREKFDDSSLDVAYFSEQEVYSSDNSVLILLLGFFGGAALMVVVLFIWFVLDRKIRTEEDVKYYTGVECFGRIKRRK